MELSFFDAQGEELHAPLRQAVAGNGQKQFVLGALRELGVGGDDYRVSVKTLSGGPVFPYGNLVRTGGDPSFVDAGEGGSAKVFLVGVYSGIAAGGTLWGTDSVLFNPTDAPQQVKLSLTRLGPSGNAQALAPFTLQPGQSLRLRDVVEDKWSHSGAGVLTFEMTGKDGVFPVVIGERYDYSDPSEVYGNVFQPLTEDDAAERGRVDRPGRAAARRRLPHARSSSSTPTSTKSGVANVVFRAASDGRELARVNMGLSAGTMRNLTPAQIPAAVEAADEPFTVGGRDDPRQADRRGAGGGRGDPRSALRGGLRAVSGEVAAGPRDRRAHRRSPAFGRPESCWRAACSPPAPSPRPSPPAFWSAAWERAPPPRGLCRAGRPAAPAAARSRPVGQGAPGSAPESTPRRRLPPRPPSCGRCPTSRATSRRRPRPGCGATCRRGPFRASISTSPATGRRRCSWTWRAASATAGASRCAAPCRSSPPTRATTSSTSSSTRACSRTATSSPSSTASAWSSSTATRGCCGPTPGGIHHDLDLGPEGEIYALERIGGQVPEVSREHAVLEDYVAILSPDGRLRRRVSILRALLDSPYAPLVRDAPDEPDMMHTNTLELLDGRHAARLPAFRAGNVLVSIPKMDAVAVLDLDAGRAVWALKGMWRRQHQPSLLPNGHLLVFDNLGAGNASRVLEIDPLTQRVAWSYGGRPEDGFFTRNLGSCHRLPNGNTLIVESKNGRAFEVTAEGETVWEWVSPERAGERGELVAALFDMERLPAEPRLRFGGPYEMR